MTPVFLGKVSKGYLTVDEPNRFRGYLFGMEGKQVQVLVRLPRKPRSNQENRYYWGVVIRLLAEHTGYSDQEMHDALRMLFLQDHVASNIPTIRSTALLSTVEFEEYLTNIRNWAAKELGCNIPEPNEVEV